MAFDMFHYNHTVYTDYSLCINSQQINLILIYRPMGRYLIVTKDCYFISFEKNKKNPHDFQQLIALNHTSKEIFEPAIDTINFQVGVEFSLGNGC